MCQNVHFEPKSEKLVSLLISIANEQYDAPSAYVFLKNPIEKVIYW